MKRYQKFILFFIGIAVLSWVLYHPTPSKEKVMKDFLTVFYTTNQDLAYQQQDLIEKISSNVEVEPYYQENLKPLATDKAIRYFEESAIPTWQTKFQSWHIRYTSLKDVSFQALEDHKYTYEATIEVEHDTQGQQIYHVTGRLILTQQNKTWLIDGFLEKTSLYALLENDYRTVE